MTLFRTRVIFHQQKPCAIVLQNRNGPCPLIALINVLSLRGQISILTYADRDGCITSQVLCNVLAEALLLRIQQQEDMRRVEDKMREAHERNFQALVAAGSQSASGTTTPDTSCSKRRLGGRGGWGGGSGASSTRELTMDDPAKATLPPHRSAGLSESFSSQSHDALMYQQQHRSRRNSTSKSSLHSAPNSQPVSPVAMRVNSPLFISSTGTPSNANTTPNQSGKSKKSLAGGSPMSPRTRSEYATLEVLDSIPAMLSNEGAFLNVFFTAGVEGYEFTNVVELMDACGVRLVHGWLIDPQDTNLIKEVGNDSYNTLTAKVACALAAADERTQKEKEEIDCEMKETAETATPAEEETHSAEGCVLEAENTPISTASYLGEASAVVTTTETNTLSGDSRRNSEPPTFPFFQHFLEQHPSQLTTAGLFALHDSVYEGELCVLFRSDHFSVLTKRRNILLTLVTDESLSDELAKQGGNIAWETLEDISGEGSRFAAAEAQPRRRSTDTATTPLGGRVANPPTVARVAQADQQHLWGSVVAGQNRGSRVSQTIHQGVVVGSAMRSQSGGGMQRSQGAHQQVHRVDPYQQQRRLDVEHRPQTTRTVLNKSKQKDSGCSVM